MYGKLSLDPLPPHVKYLNGALQGKNYIRLTRSESCGLCREPSLLLTSPSSPGIAMILSISSCSIFFIFFFLSFLHFTLSTNLDHPSFNFCCSEARWRREDSHSLIPALALLRSQRGLIRVGSTQLLHGAFGGGAVQLADHQLVQVVGVRQPSHQQTEP
ncbi:hypothetical protein EYF80_045519 [Liparis tanakae]|uniref:Uncharacterized protein n=1 Tax=Liparis tanakae TaxID=230148 RepID=A0A4Z2FUE3_9TELE|nr:hypothetical protein EYF80_045519 [Liparis tanakae]